MPAASAAISASRSAVPLGASFFMRWCRSTISMSAASPRARAASRHQPHQQVDRPAHVGRDQERDRRGRGLLELAPLRRLEAGRPDDQGDPAAPRRSGPARGWPTGWEKSIMASTLAVEPSRVDERDAQGPDPRQRAGVLAQPGMAGPLDGAGQPRAPDPRRSAGSAGAPSGPRPRAIPETTSA